MKYTSIIAAVLLTASLLPARAQNPVVAPLEYGESVIPVTAVRVALTVEKESVTPGPYARYAQKYLGAMPPLSERVTYSIKSAALGAGEYTAGVPEIESGDGLVVKSNVWDPAGFVRFPADRMTAAEMTAENMAREAAGKIYTLRKRRYDLVTGEAGEMVFGEGLRAALQEMARIEEEYVSLFMGKTTVETVTRVIEVVPETGKATYVVCRFSPEEGIRPESDLSAAPIVLTVTAERLAAAVPRVDKKGGAPYRVAAWADCVLTDGSETLAEGRLPLFQLGETVYGK